MKKQRYHTKTSTAARMNFARAWDNCHPPDARVCEDTVALNLVKPSLRFFAKTGIGRAIFRKMIYPWQIGVMAYCALRTRLIDERLHRALEEGLSQVVILGAGYDTRPYRFEAFKSRTKAFEVDQPSIQADKRDKLENAFGRIPDHVTYVPVDFEKDDLAECLRLNGYDANCRTFFIWEGVTFYLDPEAVDQTLGFVASNSAPGSSIIFDYVSPDVVHGTSSAPIVSEMLDCLRQLGEPYKFGTEPATINSFLSQRGFTEVEDHSTQDLIDRYHRPANEKRPVVDLYHIVYAVVGPS